MPMNEGDRVTLTRNGAGGVVKGSVDDGAAYVRLDSGTSCTFGVDELEVEEKTWPPRGIETK